MGCSVVRDNANTPPSSTSDAGRFLACLTEFQQCPDNCPENETNPFGFPVLSVDLEVASSGCARRDPRTCLSTHVICQRFRPNVGQVRYEETGLARDDS